MQLDQALTNIAVLGAAGKMGSGIALLLLQEISRLSLEKFGKIDNKSFVLNLIDINSSAFPQIRAYLRDQLYKYAEKNINALRKFYATHKDLVSNEEIITAYVNETLDITFFDTHLDSARGAKLVFEAIIEDVDLKVKVFRTLVEHGNKEGFFLTNTSSIPIHILNEKAQLNNRIIGFHFYNPPAIQKLLEIIPPAHVNQDLIKIADALAQRLKKTIVYSQDIAGFIGNGYLIREVSFACQKVEELAKQYSFSEAIYIVNRVTQDWLIRPMGIFQLIDYVGLDVCQHIRNIMNTFLKDSQFSATLIDEMVNRGLLGGQHPDGTQRDGFFSYTKHAPQGIYCLSKECYIPLATAPWLTNAEINLGALSQGHLTWKDLQKETYKEELLKKYFINLLSQPSLGSSLAQDFLKNLHAIVNTLVHEGIASSQADVNTVLMNGFYHLYGVHNLSKG